MGSILIPERRLQQFVRRASKISSPPEGLPPARLEVLDLLAERLDAVLHLQSFRQVSATARRTSRPPAGARARCRRLEAASPQYRSPRPARKTALA